VLLEATALTIDTIATRVGFTSAANLREHFASTLHTTPSAYRRRFQHPPNDELKALSAEEKSRDTCGSPPRAVRAGTSPRTMMRVVLVGMGTIGTTHAEVLGDHDAFDLVGVADARPEHVPVDDRLSVFAELSEALAELSPHLTVVATPTGTHAAVLEQILEAHPTCAVLIEKPAAASVAERAHLGRLLARHSDRRVLFAHHTAYAPEVLWAAHWVQRETWVGSLQRATCVFQDPYARDVAGYRQRLGSSWLDSGINALSVLERFASVGRPLTHRELDGDGHAEEVVMTLETSRGSVEATIVTSWQATASAKSTRLTYGSGAEILLDHTGVSAFVSRDGRVVARFGTDGAQSRRTQHYRNLYDTVAADPDPLNPDPLMGWPTTRRLLQALLLAQDDTASTHR
jgi:predicted dehydrogenase